MWQSGLTLRPPNSPEDLPGYPKKYLTLLRILIEIAGRSIGGLCARTLRFGIGLSLEELVIRHALGLDVKEISREDQAAGVMMIPIPRAGVLEEVRGVRAAEAVTGIQEVTITTHLGKLLVPLPEGSSYLGFIFARSARPDEVEQALRESALRLEFEVNPES